MKVNLKLNRPQSQFWVSDADPKVKIVAMICGVGTGKSFLSVRKAFHLCSLYPGSVGLLAANTYDQLNDTLIRKLSELFEELDFEEGVDYIMGRMPPKSWKLPSRKFKSYDKVVTFRESRSCLMLRSLDNPKPIRGSEYDFAFLDETRDTTREAFTIVLARMRGTKGNRVIYITTTPAGKNWLYDMVTDPSPMVSLIRGSTFDNEKNLPEDYITSQMQVLSEEEIEQEIYGNFVSFSDLVYTSFNQDINVNDTLVYDPRQELYLGVDFNHNHISWVIGQPNNLGGIDIVDEVYREKPKLNKSALESAAEDFIEKFRVQRGMLTIFGDSSGNNASARTSETDYQILKRIFNPYFKDKMRISIPSRNPSVVDRVNLTNSMLRNALGKVRIQISPRCKNLIRDFEGVVWKSDKREINKSEKYKHLTHATDALGYMLWTNFGSSRIRPSSSSEAPSITSIAADIFGESYQRPEVFND